FLRSHREAIAAKDLFTVTTITFGVLSGFFVTNHDRRRILHFNVTKHRTRFWVIQQLRGAFPLKRLLADYVGYYHEDRTHLGFGKEIPVRRIRSGATGRIISHDRLGGLHHRYGRAARPWGLVQRPRARTLSFIGCEVDPMAGCSRVGSIRLLGPERS
ncbi:MAG: hypothetical protein WA681_15860, partial [Candidatus Acidiferrales bacterium]